MWVSIKIMILFIPYVGRLLQGKIKDDQAIKGRVHQLRCLDLTQGIHQDTSTFGETSISDSHVRMLA